MWEEMEVESSTWKVPAARMKARREHRVPLTGRALELLSQARELDGAGQRPGISGRKPKASVRHGYTRPCCGDWEYPRYPTGSAAASRTGAWRSAVAITGGS